MSDDLGGEQIRLEAAYRSLDRVIGWIGNADTKALIFLTFDGVLAGVLAANAGLVSQTLAQLRPSAWQDVIVALLVAFTVVFLASVFTLLGTLFPRVGKNPGNKGRLIFFGSIANLPQSDFIKDAMLIDADSVEEALLEQIFVNSKVAAKKFAYLRISVALAIMSVALIIVGTVCILLSSENLKLPFLGA